MSIQVHHVVFDCVVFAQALINPMGPAGECVEHVRQGRVRLFVSPYVLDEIRELPSKLPAKYGLTVELAEELIDQIVTFAAIVSQVPNVYTHPHDPDDSHYVNLALATGSTLIVSRDRHLLNLMDDHRAEGREFRQRFPHLVVVPPDVFARQVREERLFP